MDINNLWSGYDLNSKKQNTRCLAVNTILEGKYLVGPVLGQGGFGITYVGYDLNMEAKIAIKEYFPVELVSRDTTTMHGDRVLSLSGEKSVTYKQGLKKYVAEAQNVSQFSEIPGVVSVKDFFYANETAYIVMEYIDGISLKDYLKEKGGSLTEEETLRIMKPVLEALVQVHKSGIIHRDISPDNIMLTFEGSGHSKIKSVKLIDFGAARMTAKNDQKSLTIILKHGYAPEEQYRTHGEQGPWTDVYALCAVLYRMLTGETPVPAMDRMFQDELKTFDKFNAKVSANTAAAILKGLAVKKDDRIQSVQDLIAALYEGVKVKTIVGTGKNGKNKIGLFAGIGVAAVSACIAGVMFLFGSSGNAVQGSQAAIQENVPGVTTVAQANLKPNVQDDMVQNQMTLDINESEDPIGEQVAFYHPQNSISEQLFCLPDGTVKARGENEYGQCDVVGWDHIVSVATGSFHSLGLRSDGKVFATGQNTQGQCDVDFWSDVVQICAGPSVSFGVTKEGNVLIAGYLGDIKRGEAISLTNISSWKDIKRIAFNVHGTVIGLKYDGTIVFEGMKPVEEIAGWDKVEEIFFDTNRQLIGIETDGTVRDAQIFEEFEPRDYSMMPKMKYISDYQEGVTVDGKVLNPYEEIKTFDPIYYNELAEEWYDWTDMEALYNTGYVTYGIKSDGTFIQSYDNEGNAALEEFNDLRWAQLVDRYDRGTAILAQKKTGEMLYFGADSYLAELSRSFDSETKIRYAAFDMCLLEDGRLLSAHEELPKEGVKWIARTQDGCAVMLENGKIQSYSLNGDYQAPEETNSWKNVEKAYAYNYRMIGLMEDGTVIDSSENTILGTEIEQIEFEPYSCLGLRADGTVEVLLADEDTEGSGNLLVYNWSDITQVAMGTSHTAGLKRDGTVVATGDNHCGQCDVESWKDVVYIDASENCTIGITKDGELLMAGSL